MRRKGAGEEKFAVVITKGAERAGRKKDDTKGAGAAGAGVAVPRSRSSSSTAREKVPAVAGCARSRTNKLHPLLQRVAVLVNNLHLLEDGRFARLAGAEEEHLDDLRVGGGVVLDRLRRLVHMERTRTGTKVSDRRTRACTHRQLPGRRCSADAAAWPGAAGQRTSALIFASSGSSEPPPPPPPPSPPPPQRSMFSDSVLVYSRIGRRALRLRFLTHSTPTQKAVRRQTVRWWCGRRRVGAEGKGSARFTYCASASQLRECRYSTPSLTWSTSFMALVGTSGQVF